MNAVRAAIEREASARATLLGSRSSSSPSPASPPPGPSPGSTAEPEAERDAKQGTLPTIGPLTFVTRPWSRKVRLLSASVLDEPLCAPETPPALRAEVEWRFEYRPAQAGVPGTLADQQARAYNVFLLLFCADPARFGDRAHWCDFLVRQCTRVTLAAAWIVSASQPRGAFRWYVGDPRLEKHVTAKTSVPADMGGIVRPLGELEELLVHANGVFTLDADETRQLLRSGPVFLSGEDGQDLAPWARRVRCPLERLEDKTWQARDPVFPGTSSEAERAVRAPLRSEAEAIFTAKRPLPDSLDALRRLVHGDDKSQDRVPPMYDGPSLASIADEALPDFRPLLWRGSKRPEQYIPDQVLMHVHTKTRGLATDLGLWRASLSDLAAWNELQPWWAEPDASWARRHGAAGTPWSRSPLLRALLDESASVSGSGTALLPGNHVAVRALSGPRGWAEAREQAAAQLLLLVDLCNAAYGLRLPLQNVKKSRGGGAGAGGGGGGGTTTEHVTIEWSCLCLKIDKRTPVASFEAQRDRRVLERGARLGTAGIAVGEEESRGGRQTPIDLTKVQKPAVQAPQTSGKGMSLAGVSVQSHARAGEVKSESVRKGFSLEGVIPPPPLQPRQEEVLDAVVAVAAAEVEVEEIPMASSTRVTLPPADSFEELLGNEEGL